MTFNDLDAALALRTQYNALLKLRAMLGAPAAAACLTITTAEENATQPLTIPEARGVVDRWLNDTATALAKLSIYPPPEPIAEAA